MFRCLGLAVLCSGVFLPGCFSGARQVNQAAVRAFRESLSSKEDRERARATFKRLAEEGKDYRIGATDVLEIGVFQWEMSEETKTLSPRVSQQGTISLPLIGDLMVKDKTVGEVRRMIKDALKGGFIKDPRVSVVIKEFRSKRVSVVGSVKDPGMYTLRQNVTRLLDILSLAGGLSESAGQRLRVVRTRPVLLKGNEIKQGKVVDLGGKETMTIDLHDLLVLGDQELNVVLGDGDLVHVPVAEKFFVYGFVHKPGGYDLKRNTTVLEAVAMAGGLEHPMASPSACVIRRKDHELPVDLTAIAEGHAPDYYLKGGDILDVRQTAWRRFGLTVWTTFKSIFHVGIAYSLNQ